MSVYIYIYIHSYVYDIMLCYSMLYYIIETSTLPYIMLCYIIYPLRLREPLALVYTIRHIYIYIHNYTN